MLVQLYLSNQPFGVYTLFIKKILKELMLILQKSVGLVVEELPEPPSEVYGGTLATHAPPAPGPRSDSVQALRNLVNRQRARVSCAL